MNIHFTKMHGNGNDFIMIDNRKGIFDDRDLKLFIKRACHRKLGVGADGLILLEYSLVADFKMQYYNSDSSVGEMCGNGARCTAKFAYINNVVKEQMTFETLDGIYQAKIHADETISIYFPDINKQTLQLHRTLIADDKQVDYHHGNIGVPHTVIINEGINLMSEEAFELWGKQIREHAAFPQGTNVNLVEIIQPQTIAIRTYERGVEKETLACGSGASASAIMIAQLTGTKAPYHVNTRGGLLTINFKEEDDWITNLSLRGPAVTVYHGIWQLK